MRKTFITFLAAIVLVGCHSTKNIPGIIAENVVVNPSPVNYDNGSFNTTVTLTLPPKSVGKNDVLTFLPVLSNSSQTFNSPSCFTVQGESVENIHNIISYKNGRTIAIPAMFAYQKGMEAAELALLVFSGESADASKQIQRIPLNVHTFCTPLLLEYTEGGMPVEGDDSNLAKAKRYLLQGRYNMATTLFEQIGNDNNTLLAQILAQNYAAARKTLAEISPATDITNYLAAILAARTGGNDELKSLLLSISDVNLLQRAMSDIEFKDFELDFLKK